MRPGTSRAFTGIWTLPFVKGLVLCFPDFHPEVSYSFEGRLDLFWKLEMCQCEAVFKNRVVPGRQQE